MHNILQKCSRVFVPVFLYDVTMLIFQIKKIISCVKWFNYVVACFFLFSENAKNLGRSDDAIKRRKNGEGLGWPKNKLE